MKFKKYIMAQITEDYVSFETAKLLKEKGFDGEVHPVGSKNIYEPYKGRLIGNIPEHAIIAPTLQMAMKWLNESHNLYIFARPYVNEDGVSYLYEIKRLHKHKLMIEPVATETCFEKSEQACEAAIKYCLENLVK